MLTLIGIFIFALAEFLFDYFASAQSTNWYIFYFSSTYLSIGLIAFDLMMRETSKAMQWAAVGFAIFFIVLMGMEIAYINKPFVEYINNVNENKIRVLTMGLLSIFLLFTITLSWEKRLSKK
jgi:hypothetical protein